jgi:hypothetical protein
MMIETKSEVEILSRFFYIKTKINYVTNKFNYVNKGA